MGLEEEGLDVVPDFQGDGREATEKKEVSTRKAFVERVD